MTDLNVTGQLNRTPINELSRTRQTIEVNSKMEPQSYSGPNQTSCCTTDSESIKKIQ